MWRYLGNGDKVRVSKRTGRIIPIELKSLRRVFKWFIIIALREVLRTNTMFANYVDDVNEADHIDGFESYRLKWFIWR